MQIRFVSEDSNYLVISLQGIGLEIAKKIGANGFRTILACRSEARGKSAEKALKALGYDVEFRLLDVSQGTDFSSFVAGLDRDYGKVDVLVNNAAILSKHEDPTPIAAQGKPTLDINFYGTLKLTEAMLPLLRKSSSPRLVNVASQLGHLNIITKTALRAQFASADSTLTLPELLSLIAKFQSDLEAGRSREGWPTGVYGVYGMSKLGLIAATKILARQEPSILINACCPGYCDTDMTSHQGTKSTVHCCVYIIIVFIRSSKC